MRKLHRIIAALAIGALPLFGGLYLGWRTMGEIDAARLEADGVRYAGLVLPELVSLAKDGKLPIANPALGDAARTANAKFDTDGLSRAYDALKAELASGAHPAAARNAAAMLVARIHETSGLTAQAASGDVAAQLTQVPQTANAAPLSPALMGATRYAPTVLPAEIKRLEEVLGEFRAATADGGATAAGKAYAAAAKDLAERVAAGIAVIPDAKTRLAFDWAGLDAAHDAFQDTALALGRTSETAMRSVLERRIADAGVRLYGIAGVSGVLALVLGAGAFFGLGRMGQPTINQASLSFGTGTSGTAGHDSRGDMGASMTTTSTQAKVGSSSPRRSRQWCFWR